MTSEDLFAASRSGSEKYRIDKVLVRTGQGDWTGVGTICVGNDRFRIEVALDAGQGEPPPPGGLLGHILPWEVQGVLDGNRRFVAPSASALQLSNVAFRKTLTMETALLELEPSRMDFLSQVSARFDDETQVTRSAAPDENAKAGSVQSSFRALLPRFELIFQDSETQVTEINPFLGKKTRSTRDTCAGAVPGWIYGLIQRDGDLEVHFRSIGERKSHGKEQDEMLFNAFLDALAFTHGQHALPVWLQHRHGGEPVRDYVRLDTDSTRSLHAPFNRRMGLNPNLQWKLQDGLASAYTFFAATSRLADEIRLLLDLLRESTASSVPDNIRLLTICSLFESLVHAIYCERIVSSEAEDRRAFQTAKEQVCQDIIQRAKEGDRHQYDRLHAIVLNAEPVNVRAKFDALASYFKLSPQYWDEVYAVWRKHRNPMSHRITKGIASKPTNCDGLITESRITGAINFLVLKMMGYFGPAVVSPSEDMLTMIPCIPPGTPEAGESRQDRPDTLPTGE